MRKLKTGYIEYSADDVADLGDKVGPNVALIPKFVGILPTPATIALQVTDVRARMTATGPGAKTALHASMRTLARSLALMATNLMEVTDVTDSDLAATEFPLVKERERTTTVPDAPSDLRVRHGTTGEILGTCNSLGENIINYEIQWTLDPNAGPWTDGEPTSSSRGFKLEGLPRGKDIWIRVRARNVVGPGDWSDPATIMVI